MSRGHTTCVWVFVALVALNNCFGTIFHPDAERCPAGALSGAGEIERLIFRRLETII